MPSLFLTSIGLGLESCKEVLVLLPVEDDLGPSLFLTSIGPGLESCKEVLVLLPVEDDLCPAYFLPALVLDLSPVKRSLSSFLWRMIYAQLISYQHWSWI